MSAVDEREAVRRMRRGEIDALEPLVRRYQLRAVRTAWLITRDRQQAEDVVQSAFIRAFERIHQLRSDDAFGAWFLRAVVNDATRAASRAGRQTPIESDDSGDTLARLIDPDASPDELIAGIETSEELWAALGALPPPQRAAIVLRYYAGLSEREMAHELAIPPGTVKWRLHAARERLRHLLRPTQSGEITTPVEEQPSE